MAVEMERESLITEAHNAPVTSQRRVRNDLETSLPKPCKFSIVQFELFQYLKMTIKKSETCLLPQIWPGH